MLREQAEAAFREATQLAADGALPPALRQVVENHARLLDAPIRVAIAGRIKAGKSTLTNALLGEELVATGSLELTFNVNWLRYGNPTALTVHFKDGQLPNQYSLAELEALTRRQEAGQASDTSGFLKNIKHIEVVHPNPALRIYDLIDTPGLDSTYQADSRNTLDWMGISPEEVDELTRNEVRNAHAVLFMFNRGLSQGGVDFLSKFTGSSRDGGSPLNAIGVLSQADQYWRADGTDPSVDPFISAERVAQRYANDTRRQLYTVLPVAALLGLGARTMTEDEFGTLVQLAELPQGQLARLTSSPDRLERPSDDVAVPVPARQLVARRLGTYGVWRACHYLREGVDSREALRELLSEESRIPRLEHLLRSHFGNRSLLIKLDSAVRETIAACFALERHLAGAPLEAVETVHALFEDLGEREIGFRELQVLRDFYEGRLSFSDSDGVQLLQLTGEEGTSCASRVGLNERAIVDEVVEAARQRHRYWQSRLYSTLLDGPTQQAIEVMEQSLRRIIHHAGEARKHLYLDV